LTEEEINVPGVTV